ncbi:hypothetical protein KR49_00070 [Synechococcus sp. KORDI-49]|nr:hypothetical protein KR49_00070 [Synechococcus sp. KORDI-49]
MNSLLLRLIMLVIALILRFSSMFSMLMIPLLQFRLSQIC